MSRAGARGPSLLPGLRPLLLGGAMLLAAASCSSGRGAVVTDPVVPSPAGAWDSVQTLVEQLVGAGRYSAADTMLHSFERRYSAVAEGAEALYWRALLALDPANPGSSPRAAVRTIDHYLARGAEQPRYAQALVLRRTAEAIDALQRMAVAEPPAQAAPSSDTVAAERARATAEIQRLRQELDRTQAELQRLRERVRP